MIGKTMLHYRIIEELGRGGMGVVYLAEDTRLERQVAIKFLPDHIAASKQDRQRFEIEAKAAAALNHPNIATIHAIEEADNDVFIVMEYIDGLELKDHLNNETITTDEVIDISKQIVQGLQAAHEQGIIHRDIKSRNIILTAKGQIKIMDFGLAKVRGNPELTKAGNAVGTTAYMSPEQMQGKAVDQRSDIWSFGVLLYGMLTGEMPFKGDYEQAMMYAIINEEPSGFSDQSLFHSPALAAIVRKCLQKDVAERYQNMAEVLADFAALAEGGIPATQDAGKTSFLKRRFVKSGLMITAFIILIVFAWHRFSNNENVQPDIRSIAVLPFVNTNEDPAIEYLSDGLTEALINKLSPLPQLRVMARSTVFYYKGRETHPLEIGRHLGVNAILTGNIVQFEDKLRLQAELVDISDGSQLWGEQYNTSLNDILTVQDAMANKITEGLRLQLAPEDRTRLARNYTSNTAAYQAYLRGQYYWNKRTREDFETALTYFQEAVEYDSTYALAYAGLANCYALYSLYDIKKPSESFPRAKEMVLKALDIDPELAEAHAVSGLIHTFYNWDWPAAENSFRRAIALKPDYGTAYHWYSLFKRVMNQHAEALNIEKQALLYDPLSLVKNQNLGAIYVDLGQHDNGIEQLNKVLEIDPTYTNALLSLGYAYLNLKNYPAALEKFNQAVASGRYTTYLARIKAYLVTGEKALALADIAYLEAKAEQFYVDASYFAQIYWMIGDKPKTLSSLEKALADRSFIIPWYDPSHPHRNLKWVLHPQSNVHILADPDVLEILQQVPWPE